MSSKRSIRKRVPRDLSSESPWVYHSDGKKSKKFHLHGWQIKLGVLIVLAVIFAIWVIVNLSKVEDFLIFPPIKTAVDPIASATSIYGDATSAVVSVGQQATSAVGNAESKATSAIAGIFKGLVEVE